MPLLGWSPQAYTGPVRTCEGRRRICFELQFEATHLEQYLKDHEAVWPEMQRALVQSGWHNYSLFYRPDGRAIGYFETEESFEVACQRMDAFEVNGRWQAAMAKYTAQGQSPIVGAADLKHYFYLGTDVEGGAPVVTRPALALAAAAFGLGVACGVLVARSARRC